MQDTPAIPISIIICTRNRAQSLRETLLAIRALQVPAFIAPKLLIVDNGSTEATANVVKEYGKNLFDCQYVVEPRPGKTNAYNTALKHAAGEILLFTDDDVRLPADWIERMCRSIIEGECEATVGAVRLEPALERPWMTPLHRSWLADNQWVDPARPVLIGANMAIARKCFDAGLSFDQELGPGALGFFEESLLTEQLALAGFRLQPVFDCVVEHAPGASRLLCGSLLDTAKKSGRCRAYLAHHWYRTDVTLPALRLFRWKLTALWQRLLYGELNPSIEGIHPARFLCHEKIAFYEQYLIERRRPRRYAQAPATGRPPQCVPAS